MRAFIAVIFLTTVALAGCETTKGAGKDIQNTGTNIERGINATTGNTTNETMNNTSRTMGDSGTGGADTGVGSGSDSGMGGGY